VKETRLLLVEDEDAIVRPLTAALAREGFLVSRFRTAEEALEAIPHIRPAVAVLDIALPGMSGLDACRIIKQRWTFPVLMLTARGASEDRILGLELGADDYVPKPFSSRELVARLRAVLRRVAWGVEGSRPITIGDLCIDRDRREVRVGSGEIHVTPREFDLLSLLAERSPQVVRRIELLRQVWDPHWNGPDATLDVHMAKLRRKIEPDPRHPRYLHTVRGVGYRLADQPA
jgi:two-component system, OmpR family, response regulator RegX3